MWGRKQREKELLGTDGRASVGGWVGEGKAAED